MRLCRRNIKDFPAAIVCRSMWDKNSKAIPRRRGNLRTSRMIPIRFGETMEIGQEWALMQFEQGDF